MSQSTLTEQQERAINEAICRFMDDGFEWDEYLSHGTEPRLSKEASPYAFTIRKAFTRSLDSMALAEAKLTIEQYCKYMEARWCAALTESENGYERWTLVILNRQPASIRAAALCEVIQGGTDAE